MILLASYNKPTVANHFYFEMKSSNFQWFFPIPQSGGTYTYSTD